MKRLLWKMILEFAELTGVRPIAIPLSDFKAYDVPPLSFELLELENR